MKWILQQKKLIGKLAKRTSTLNMSAPRPKNSEPNCIIAIMLMAEDKIPPKNRYSLRFASKAAPVKQAKIAVEPRKATMTILQQQTPNEYKNESLRYSCFPFVTYTPSSQKQMLQSE